MRRIPKSAAWMYFNGVYSYERGAFLIETPQRYQPGLKGKSHEVSGRSGSVWTGDGGYSDIEVTVDIAVPEPEDRAGVNSWLTGSGALIFGDEPDLAYDARIVKTYKRTNPYKRLSAQEYQVTFDCLPFKRVWPEPGALVFTASGSTFFNPGTAPALPRVKIEGAGEFTVTINGQTLYFSGVESGIIVDSELMDALTLDGTGNANNKCSGTPWELAPGAGSVSWAIVAAAEGEDPPGSVTKVTIWPRWRCI